MKGHRLAGHFTDREIVVVAAVMVAGSEKGAAHRLDPGLAAVRARRRRTLQLAVEAVVGRGPVVERSGARDDDGRRRRDPGQPRLGVQLTRVRRALATYEIPIEGRAEWLTAARWLA